MKNSLLRVLSVMALLSVVLSSSVVAVDANVQNGGNENQSGGSLPPDLAKVEKGLAGSPVMFIENVGQYAQGARFLVRGGERSIWLAEDAIWVTVLSPLDESESPVSQKRHLPGMNQPFPDFGEEAVENQPRLGANLRLSFVGANPHAEIEPFERLETKVSYFMGSDPDQWRPDVPVWGGVRYKNLYPGIDLEFGSQAGELMPRLVARAGADLSRVTLRMEGAQDVALNASDGANGDAGMMSLRISTNAGDFSLPLFQVDGVPLPSSRAALQQRQVDNQMAFDIAAPFSLVTEDTPEVYSAQAQPTGMQSDALLYSTYLGGSGQDYGSAIAVDSSGAAYVTGSTESTDFPTTPGAFDETSITRDAFVTKLNASGSALLYSTYLGGSSVDYSNAIVVDSSGVVYMTGYTSTSDFPTTPGAFDTTYDGYGDGFVTKLSASGSALLYSTYLGGGDGLAIAVDSSGAAYVTGWTSSSDFPTTPGAFDTTHNGMFDGFVAKLNPSGSALLYSTYLGGSKDEMILAIALDSSGAIYVTGITWSYDFPTTPGAFDSTQNEYESAFVIKLDTSGSALLYSTHLEGSSARSQAHAVAVDGSGAAYVTGHTYSSDFPVTPGAFDTTHSGSWGYDGFVTKLNASGSALLYSTFLGGSNEDEIFAIALDSSGAAYVTGYTLSSDFPTTPGAFDTINEYQNAFVAKLNASGSALLYSTYLGGTSWNLGEAIALDSIGAAYVTGYTYSSDFPTTPGVFDSTFGGVSDGFVTKLAIGPFSVSGTVTDGGSPIPNVSVRTNTGIGAITDAAGVYTITSLITGTYTISPESLNYTFSPSSQIASVGPDVSGLDFTGQFIKRPVILIPGMMASANWPCFFYSSGCDITSQWNWFPIMAYDTYKDLINLFGQAGYTEEDQYFSVLFYDWRRPLQENVPVLKQRIEQLKSATGAGQVDLIGHSMGGLVGRAYIQSDQYAGDVAHLFTLGSPHKGAAILYPLWEGGEIYHFSIDPSWDQYLWTLSIGFYQHINKYPGAIGVAFVRSFAPGARDILYTEDYLYEDRTNNIINESDMKQRNSYLPLLNSQISTLFSRTDVSTFAGIDYTTPCRFYVYPYNGWLWPNWDDGEPNWGREGEFLCGLGDNTVMQESALISGAHTETFITNHGGLPGNADVQDKIFATLGISAPVQSRQAQMQTSAPGAAIMILALYGPATATVTDAFGQTIGPGGASMPGAEYISDPSDPFKLFLIPNPAEGQFTIDVQGSGSGDYSLGLLDTFGPPEAGNLDIMGLWDASRSQIEPSLHVTYALTYTTVLSPTTSLMAVTPVIEMPVRIYSLTVNGRAAPGQTVEIRDADSQVLLGSGVVDETGHYAITLLAPLELGQRIYAWSNGVSSIPVTVQAFQVYLPLSLR